VRPNSSPPRLYSYWTCPTLFRCMSSLQSRQIFPAASFDQYSTLMVTSVYFLRLFPGSLRLFSPTRCFSSFPHIQEGHLGLDPNDNDSGDHRIADNGTGFFLKLPIVFFFSVVYDTNPSHVDRHPSLVYLSLRVVAISLRLLWFGFCCVVFKRLNHPSLLMFLTYLFFWIPS